MNPFSSFQIVDLTHTITPTIPTWGGGCGFKAEMKLDYPQGCRVHKYTCYASIGTHIDAPCHFIPHAPGASDLRLEDLICPLRVLDVSSRCSQELFIGEEDIALHEKQFGLIPRGSCVAGYTGWSKHWNHPEQYRNPDATGKMRFPGFSAAAAELLLERGVFGLAIDTLSPDGSDHTYPVHHLFLGHHKYLIENMANLDRMPPSGGYLLALPLKIAEGAEAPMRAIGLKPLQGD